MTLIAKIITELAIIKMNCNEEMEDGCNPLNKAISSLIKAETKKNMI
ncbi:hypothetical protein G6M26_30875 [Agrobacterium tumefaciens]|nr:hypothetical protein [Agrobacterium tumefaciens]NTE22956.1 hypothetical protein [Agrobacterium tumefaciens]